MHDAADRPHPCRADLARAAHRALDTLRPTPRSKILDRHRRVVSFAPGSIFAFVRWAANDFGTIISRIDIVRAVAPGEPYQTLPFVRPGGDILLRIDGWPKVERVLQAIDAVEALGVDPADAAPDYWRHVHNRLTAGDEPRAYTRDTPSGLAQAAEGRAMTRFASCLTTYFASVRARRSRRSSTCRSTASGTPAPARRSASMPCSRADDLEVTDLVVVDAAEPVATFLAERGYLPTGVPLMKRVLALPGQTRLPQWPRHHRRRHRHGRRARARQRGPRSAGLARLPAASPTANSSS